MNQDLFNEFLLKFFDYVSEKYYIFEIYEKNNYQGWYRGKKIKNNRWYQIDVSLRDQKHGKENLIFEIKRRFDKNAKNELGKLHVRTNWKNSKINKNVSEQLWKIFVCLPKYFLRVISLILNHDQVIRSKIPEENSQIEDIKDEQKKKKMSFHYNLKSCG